MDDEEEILYDYDACAPVQSSEMLPADSIASQLRKAVAQDDVASIQQHLTNRHDVNLVDNLGRTCLHTAIMYGSYNSLHYLLSFEETRGNVRDNLGDTPLMLSLKHNVHFDAIKYLVEHNCDVTIPNNEGTTPLHLAAQKADSNIAHLFIKNGADVDVEDMDGFTPLHEAVRFQHHEIVCMLLYYNASVNEVSTYTLCTPFHHALRSGNVEISESLINYVDDFSLKDWEERTMFALALTNRMCIAVEIVERGGDVYETRRGTPLIITELERRDRILFRKLWAEVDILTLFKRSSKLFLPYIIRIDTHFSNEEILNILEILFTVDQYSFDYCELEIYKSVYELCPDQETRLEWTWVLLSHHIPIQASEIEYLYHNYTFCPEITAIFLSETEICYTSDDPFVELIVHNRCIDALKDRSWLIEIPNKKQYYSEISKGDVPSLLQIARDISRKIIYAKYQRDPNYKTYNFIMRMNISEPLKDILLLKRPIYT